MKVIKRLKLKSFESEMPKIYILITFLLLMILGADVLAVPETEAIALAIKVQGEVKLRRSGSIEVGSLKVGTRLNDGDWIKTERDAFAVLIFTDDKSLIKLRSLTEVVINGKRDENSSIAKKIQMEIGHLYAKVEQQRGTLQVATPTSVASVKGTRFWVIVLEDGTTQVLTLEGLIELLNRVSGQIVEVQENQQGNSDDRGQLGVEDLDPQNIPDDPAPDLNEFNRIQIEIENEQGEKKTIDIDYRIPDNENR